MNQTELILKMSDKELKRQLFISQLLFLVISVILSFFLFDSFVQWTALFSFQVKGLVYYGIVGRLIVVFIDVLLMITLPNHYLDDGGINEKLFRHRSVGEIFQMALVISICEEILFRGVLQPSFGLIIASLIFALVPVRYLKKPVLFLSVVLVSFLLGYSFYVTNNLLVPMTAHFLIDFLLGLIIRFRK